ncbi:MAG: dienelactone hydrolase family protein [Oceanicaulis sp.]|uniref:dienelactone hydrolase family protein n=1 Tax=Glycocaulis sp. TaxID=1969725 RepID=UPI0025C5C686|nr:dienelactone hydrolase family protein [Glycocaulis sp.]MCC5980690.1 dienelactone hydrolase family protein [Oceanicaulis sp.]MCH8520861.1 dienelactone hydrolase family protein [Glycocaulis sp.]
MIRAGLISLALVAPPVLGACQARTHDLDHWREAIAPHVRVMMPEDAGGPVPAVLLFSGCGGVISVQSEYGAVANQHGMAAVIIDSHAVRGIGPIGARLYTCTALRMRGDERARDVLAALAHVRTLDGIDSDRLALTGWSHGGWTLLDTLALVHDGTPPRGLDTLPDAALDGVKAAVTIYPYCGFIIRARSHDIGNTIPVDALLAEEDMIANPRTCEALFERQNANGARIDWTLFEGQTHAFDAPDQPFDPRVRYDEDATRRAHDWWIETLSIRLGDG